MEAKSAYSQAFVARDHAGIVASLNEDVLIHTAVVDKPLNGKQVADFLFQVLLDVTSPFTILNEMTDGKYSVIRFTGEIGDVPAEGLNFVEHDDQGLVKELTIYIRPMTAVQRLSEVMGGGMAARYQAHLEEEKAAQAAQT